MAEAELVVAQVAEAAGLAVEADLEVEVEPADPEAAKAEGDSAATAEMAEDLVEAVLTVVEQEGWATAVGWVAPKAELAEGVDLAAATAVHPR